MIEFESSQTCTPLASRPPKSRNRLSSACKFSRLLFGAVMALTVVDTAQAATSERAQIIAAIRAVMIDPDSLKVNKITMYPPINGVKGACASINAKNRLGGYTGNQNIIIYNEKGKWRAGSATSILTCEDMRELHKSNAMSQ